MPHRSQILTKYYFSVNQKLLSIISTIFIAFLCLGIGIIIGGNLISRPPMIINKELLIPAVTSTTIKVTDKQFSYVASKRGKYYYPLDCPLAAGLSEKNKIYFKNKEEAETEGYQFNSRCR